MAKYSLIPVLDSHDWDLFVDKSPQGTVFSNSQYLKAIGRKTISYFICKGSDIKAGIALILTDDEKCAELDDLSIYNGLIFHEDENQKNSAARIERFEITEFVINNLVKIYDKLQISLAPQFEDMRPFLWHNFRSENLKEKFRLDLRYTSYLNISEFLEEKPDEKMELFKNMERLRRRQVKEAVKANIQLEPGKDVNLLLKFYEGLMTSQDISVSEDKLVRMKGLIQTLQNNNLAEMFFLREDDGKISYVLVFCFDAKRAYALFAAGNPDISAGYHGTIAYWDALKFLAQKRNIQEVDLEGVNSPHRGWFKISFGGDLKPYFQVYYGC